MTRRCVAIFQFFGTRLAFRVMGVVAVLLYVILWNTGGRGVTGWEWFFVILAVLGDLASYGGSRYGRRRPAY